MPSGERCQWQETALLWMSRFVTDMTLGSTVTCAHAVKEMKACILTKITRLLKTDKQKEKKIGGEKAK